MKNPSEILEKYRYYVSKYPELDGLPVKEVIKEGKKKEKKKGVRLFEVKEEEVKKKEEKKKTGLQEVVDWYKECLGVAIEDKVWNKKMYPQVVKGAKTLLEVCNNDVEIAKKVLYEAKKYFEGKRLTWTIYTVVRPHNIKQFLENVKKGERRKYKWDIEL